jgi:carbamate kinase
MSGLSKSFILKRFAIFPRFLYKGSAATICGVPNLEHVIQVVLPENLMSSQLVVLAIGGNSLIKDSQHMTLLDQYRTAGETGIHIADLIAAGYRVIVTHGNGPQVGFMLLRSELAKDILHPIPLEICVADTQGATGYQLEQTLANELKRRGIQRSMATLVTQTVVDENDPAFENPTKPIGPFFTEEEARAHSEQHGWVVKEDAGRGWRRVVPSPRPIHIVETETIRTLVEQDVVVICAGGGGIPVVRDERGILQGRPAVVDKDFASSLLAKALGADLLVISTAVDKVALNFGKPDQQSIDRMTVAEARVHLADNQFAEGSMKPKIEAALEFIENGGKKVIITQPQNLAEALEGKNGTHIVP